MAQTTALAAGTTAAVSSDIVVAPGATVTVGVFTATAGGKFPDGAPFALEQITPGQPNVIATLDNARRAQVITGPGTYRVRRPVYTGAAFGVFVEA